MLPLMTEASFGMYELCRNFFIENGSISQKKIRRIVRLRSHGEVVVAVGLEEEPGRREARLGRGRPHGVVHMMPTLSVPRHSAP
jgi:hypothetical protein